MFNPIFKKKIQELKHPGRWAIPEPESPSSESLYLWFQTMGIDLSTLVIVVITQIN